jgi:CheY-like chemotaxis protein
MTRGGPEVAVDALPKNQVWGFQAGLYLGASAVYDKPESCEEAAKRRKTSSGDLGPAVLVADDEALIRSTVVEILRGEGYDAVAVKDGVAAVECASKLHPDIVLADVSMPAMNGIEAAKRIRAFFPQTRIICFSGHAQSSELLAQARKEGFDFEFLSKPLKPEILIRVLRRKSA